MLVRDWLSRQARAEARGRGALWAGRVALVGLAGIALALFCERAGFDLPLFRLPEVAEGPGFAARLGGWLVVSTAGLAQAAVFSAVVLAFALALRFALAPILHRGAPATARTLDGRLGTERFSAALEASGPLRPFVERAALRDAPPDGFLRPRAGGRRVRRLVILTLALVFVVAVLPGTAPGADGDAPVLGAPDPGESRNRLELALTGPSGALRADDPILLEVDASMTRPPSVDLELPLFFVLDEQPAIDPRLSFFLPAGGAGRDRQRLDLGGLLPPLEPGEHRVVALAGGARSNVWTFTVEGDPGGAPPPKDDPKKKPEPPPPTGGAPLPEARPRFVEPLVRDGEKVEKRARVPIEVPGGGAPRESTLDEAWPELEKRREAALNRAGLSPSARELVRRYFDTLRPEGEERK